MQINKTHTCTKNFFINIKIKMPKAKYVNTYKLSKETGTSPETCLKWKARVDNNISHDIN